MSDALLRLRAGDITVDEYLDTRVEQALDLVRGRVSSERLEMILEMIREVVRDAITHDPTVLECVHELMPPKWPPYPRA